MPSKSDDAESRLEKLLEDWQERQDQRALGELLESLLREIDTGPGPMVNFGSVRKSDLRQSAVRRLLDQDKLPRFEHPQQMRAYLRTTIANLVRDQKKKQPMQHGSDFDKAVSGGLSNSDRAADIAKVLPRLSPEEREVVELVHLQGLERSIVWERLGIAKQTGSDRELRALRKLGRLLNDRSE